MRQLKTTHIQKLINHPTPSSFEAIPVDRLKKTLTKEERQLLSYTKISASNRPIAHLNDNEIIELSRRVRREVLKRLGLRVGNEYEEAEIIRGIFDQIKKYYFLNLGEIIFAIDKALDGKFLRDGQNQVFFTLSNLAIWLDKYVQEMRKPVLQKHSRLLQDLDVPSQPPPLEVIKADQIKIVNEHIGIRKSGGELCSWGLSNLFDILVSTNIYHPTDFDWDEAKQKAEIKRRVIGEGNKLIFVKNLLYQNFIDKMAHNGMFLAENGEIVKEKYN